MKKYIFILMLFIMQSVSAQLVITDTLAFQDFEVTPAGPVWTFTGPVIYNSGYSSSSAAPPNSPIGINGSRAWETTSNSTGLKLDFANINVPAGYDSLRVRFNLAAMSLVSSTGGPDDLDYVLVSISADSGVTSYPRLRIRGAVANNSFWPYSATGIAKVYYQPQTEALFQPLNPGLQDVLGYSTCEIVFPGSVSNISLTITGRSSSSSDTWLVDNLVLVGERTCTPTFSAISPVTCNSYQSPSGDTYTASAVFNDTITNIAGCDSIITINLTVNHQSFAALTPFACDSYTSPSGQLLTTTGNYQDTIPNMAGCDSIISISLTVNNTSYSAISPVACGSYTSPSGLLLTTTGNYQDTIPNMAGCDSIISINLVIDSIYTGVNQNGITLTAIASGMQYFWIDCNNGFALVPGAVSQSFTPAVSGSYAVIINDGICTDTSECYSVVYTGMDGSPVTSLTVMPNPFSDQVTFSIISPLSETLVVTVSDECGREVYRTEFNIQAMTLHQQYLPLQTLAPGYYYLRARGSLGFSYGTSLVRQRF